MSPHPCFIQYLEDTAQENESIDIVIHGNAKENFNNRVSDQDIWIISDVLIPYAIYIEDVDLRYNHISDTGAEAISRLIKRAERLLGLNLQGNTIAIDGA